MCTAISEHKNRHLFGRTLDLECSYGEEVVITPRGYLLEFLEERKRDHHAMIGTAHLLNGSPLYYDAASERGIAAAALNFPQNAVYHVPRAGAYNLPSYALMPFILGQADTLADAVALLKSVNITNDAAHPELPPTPLHWLFADKSGAVTVESVATGLEIYENPVGVLANSPPFSYHMTHLADFMHLGAAPPQNRLCPEVSLDTYSRGMGAMGLPGDYSSSSRFVRAVFAKDHTDHGATAIEEVSRFFHLMDTVAVPMGAALTEEGRPVSTVYTSCIDTAAQIYYFTTYACRAPRAVSLQDALLNTDELVTFSMYGEENIIPVIPSPHIV